MTHEELALIRQLLEERIDRLKKSQMEVRDDSGWWLTTPIERGQYFGQLAHKQKLAESALRSLDRLELPRGSG